MDPRHEELIAYLRGHRPLMRTESTQRFIDYLEEMRLEDAVVDVPVSVKRGPGRPRKVVEDTPCV